MAFDQSGHLQQLEKFYRTTPQHAWSEPQRTGDFWHAVQALRFSGALQFTYRGALSVEDRPQWHAIPSEDPLSGPWHFLTCACFPSSAQCFLSQASFWVFQTKVECVRVSSASADARKCQVAREIASQRAFELTASGSTQAGSGQPTLSILGHW